eukprot:jgi/Galph1/1675/GphlegSOOS_G354.1
MLATRSWHSRKLLSIAKAITKPLSTPQLYTQNIRVFSSRSHSEQFCGNSQLANNISTAGQFRVSTKRLIHETPSPCTQLNSSGIEQSTSTTPVQQSPQEAREALLANPALVVSRELEWGNIFFGFEQANKYSLKTPDGRIAGFIAEEDGLGKSLLRNILRTHRSFQATILDPTGQPILVIRRPAYLFTSTLYVETPEGQPIGEIRMNWHPWRRKYDLYVGKRQLGKIDSGFLAVEFPVQDEQGNVIGSISKDFTGFAKELFTDATQYVVRLKPPNQLLLDAQGLIQTNTATPATDASSNDLSTEERAVLFAVSVSIDFDYFSLHSRHGNSFMPFPFMMPFPWPGSGGGKAEEETQEQTEASKDENTKTNPMDPTQDYSETQPKEDSRWAHFEEGKFEEPDNMFEEEDNEDSGWGFGSFFGDDDDDD